MKAENISSGKVDMTKALSTPAEHRTVWIQSLDEAGCRLRLATGSEGRIRPRTGAGIHHVGTRYRAYVEGPSRGIVSTGGLVWCGASCTSRTWGWKVPSPTLAPNRPDLLIMKRRNQK